MPQHTISLTSPTGRVKLAPPHADDDQVVSVLRVHPESRRYLRFLPECMSVDEARIRRESRAEDPQIFDLHIYVVDGDGKEQFAGITGVFHIDQVNESCEAGMLVSPDQHGKGIATEAFYTLLQYIFEQRKFHRVTFETGADNIPMQRWLESVAGARLEAQRKECWKGVDGQYTDVRGYSILDWEWRERVKGNLEKRLLPDTTSKSAKSSTAISA